MLPSTQNYNKRSEDVRKKSALSLKPLALSSASDRRWVLRLRRRLPELDVAAREVLVVLLARVLHDLGVHQRERPLVLPRLRVSLRIVDRHGVRDVSRVGPLQRLNHVQRVAVRMADRVEARVAVEANRVDDERVAVPAAD